MPISRCRSSSFIDSPVTDEHIAPQQLHSIAYLTHAPSLPNPSFVPAYRTHILFQEAHNSAPLQSPLIGPTAYSECWKGLKRPLTHPNTDTAP